MAYIKHMTNPRKPNRQALFERASEREGIFTLQDARRSGYSQPLVYHFVRAGRFQRLGRGVYRIVEYPRSKNDRVAELSAILGPAAILSNESALAMYPVSDVAPSEYHFTIPRSKRYTHPPANDVVIHTVSTPLDQRDVVKRHGFKMTSLARSIVDSARTGTAPEQIQSAIRAGLTRGLLREDDLKRAFARQSSRVRALIADTVRAWTESPQA